MQHLRISEPPRKPAELLCMQLLARSGTETRMMMTSRQSMITAVSITELTTVASRHIPLHHMRYSIGLFWIVVVYIPSLSLSIYYGAAVVDKLY